MAPRALGSVLVGALLIGHLSWRRLDTGQFCQEEVVNAIKLEFWPAMSNHPLSPEHHANLVIVGAVIVGILLGIAIIIAPTSPIEREGMRGSIHETQTTSR